MIKDLTLRRLALLLGGVALLSLGGAFFSCSGLGMDPLSVLYSGIAALTKLKLGTALFAANAVFLILLFFLDRKRIGLGTVAIVLVVGPLLNLLLCLFPETSHSFLLRLCCCGLGIVSYGVGMAFYLSADLGCGPTDGLMLSPFAGSRWALTFSVSLPAPLWAELSASEPFQQLFSPAPPCASS